MIDDWVKVYEIRWIFIAKSYETNAKLYLAFICDFSRGYSVTTHHTKNKCQVHWVWQGSTSHEKKTP